MVPTASAQCSRADTRYDALFSIEMARRQLKSDIENSIDQIKERLLATRLDPRTTTLRELVENELKPEVYGPEKCRDRALTCRNSVAASDYPPGPGPAAGPGPSPAAAAAAAAAAGALATARPATTPKRALAWPRSAVIGLLCILQARRALPSSGCCGPTGRWASSWSSCARRSRFPS